MAKPRPIKGGVEILVVPKVDLNHNSTSPFFGGRRQVKPYRGVPIDIFRSIAGADTDRLVFNKQAITNEEWSQVIVRLRDLANFIETEQDREG